MGAASVECAMSAAPVLLMDSIQSAMQALYKTFTEQDDIRQKVVIAKAILTLRKDLVSGVDPTASPAASWKMVLTASGGDHYAAGKTYLKLIQGVTVQTSIGPVMFTGKTSKKMRAGSRNDYLKAALIPKVPEILRGRHIASSGLSKERGDSFIAFHYFVADVVVGELTVTAGVAVGESAYGGRMLTAYDLTADLQGKWLNKGEGAPDDPGKDPGLGAPSEASKLDDASSMTSRAGAVNSAAEGINIVILRVVDAAGNRLPELEDGRQKAESDPLNPRQQSWGGAPSFDSVPAEADAGNQSNTDEPEKAPMAFDTDDFSDLIAAPETIEAPIDLLDEVAEPAARTRTLLDSTWAMLDDAEGLGIREKALLVKELLTIRATLLKDPPIREKALATRRLLEIRKRLGAHAAQKIAPVAAPALDADFGLQASGIKTRERLNSQVRDIVAKVKRDGLKPADLSPEDRAALMQYSGRGGLTDNSQSEYYTPTHVAGGTWDLLEAHGFKNGNVLEPSTGAGVFSATKPAGVLISGSEIDETSSAVAQLLHPEDKITHTSFERFALATADNSFDAVNGNVPFGVRGKEAHHDLAHKSEKRMERYFVRRVIDKVRPGGLVTLIVPTSVIGKKDKTWARWRAEVSMMAEFLGGHKLPSKTFGKQGTDVVTDIIVLRKHPADLLDKIQRLPVATLKAANVLWDEFIEGRYWQGEGLRFIHGTFVPGDPAAFRSEDKVIADPGLTDAGLRLKLAAHFDSRIDWQALDAAHAPVQVYAEGDRKVINGQAMEMKAGKWEHFTPTEEAETVLDPAVMGVATLNELEALLSTSEGMLSLTADQAFRAWKRFPHLFNGVQAQAVEFAIGQPQDKYRDVAYRGSLLGAMVNKYAIGDDATDRERVIALLQTEVLKYGHPSTISGMVLDGAKAQAFGAYLGAVNSKGEVSPNVRGESAKAMGYEPDNILSIVTYLGRQSGDAIDIPAIAALYKGPRKLQALGDIGDVTGIAITAHGEVTTTGAYCCGDVYDKVGQLQNAMSGNNDDRLNIHWTGLINLMMGKVRQTEISGIGFGLRENWIDAKYKAEFLRLNGYGLTYVADKAEASDGEEDESAIARSGGAWVYRGKDEFSKQLMHYLAGSSIGHNLKDRSDSTAAERRTEYQEKVKGMEEQFKFFMQSHSDGSDLTSTYNMTFNRHVAQQYDDSDLGLVGVSAAVKTHGYQNAGVRRLSDEGGGILGFDTGLGKTYSSLAYSVFDRQMGRSKKHCTVVPKSVLANWYNESKAMLGNHTGVLFVGFEPKRDKSGAIVTEPLMDENNQPKVNKHTGQIEYQDVLVEDSAAEVFAKMHSIPAMTGGLVIMTQEKFKAIPLKPETVEAYGNKWVDRSMTSAANAARLAGKDVKEGSYKGKQQEAQLENHFFEEGTKKKNELPYFEDMGFDRVIVDEAHQFKASFQIKEGMDKLAYLPNPAESQRAQDMALKLSHVRDGNGGKGAILLSATPVANSPIEIYNMLMHVIPPEELDKIGVFTPADFIRFFGSIESVQKLTVSGEIEPRDGLKGFRNLNILRSLFNRYSNMMGAKDVDPEGSVLKLPDAHEVKSQCDMTSDQQDAYVTLRDEAKKSGNPRAVAAGEARPMFAVLRDMDRVTTDMDLYAKQMTFLFKASQEPGVKAMIDALPATQMREESDEDTGEKVKVPVEKVTAYRIDGDALIYVAPDVFEYAIASRIKKFGISYASHPLTPKYTELVKNLKAELAIKGKQLVFTEEKSQHGKLSRLLVENIPENEARIGIINADTAGGEKLQEIVDAYTRGDFDIIICNKKAEVGVNLQRGTTAVHHMTLPWTPASIQQRNGRAVRQGNKVAAVRIYYYQAKGSFDEYRLDLLSKKANWINALLDKNNTEDEHDNENAGTDIEQQALLSDNREEFLAKLAEQQAKKDAEARGRREAGAKSSLSQLSAAREFGATFDARKRKALAEAGDDVVLAKKRAAAAQGLPDGEDKARTIAWRDAAVKRAEAKLAKTGPEMDGKRADAEARARQIVGTLKAQASRGELPFNERLIDTPEESIITFNKLVVCKGGLYEVTTADGEHVIRVLEVNHAAREIQLEYVIKASEYSRVWDGTFDVDKVLDRSAREVHISDSDLQLRKVLSEAIPYRQIAARVSKDVFLANIAGIKVDGYCLRRGADGVLSAGYRGNDAEKPIVYPDPSDRALRKEVAELHGASLSGSGDYNFGQGRRDIMPAIFGDNWNAAVAEFIKTATPEQITSKMIEILRQTVPDVITSVEACKAALVFLNDITSYNGNASPAVVALKDWAAAEVFVNVTQIVDGGKLAAQIQRRGVEDRMRVLEREAADRAEAERKAADAERSKASSSDPRYMELSDDHAGRFAEIGIVARFNNGDNIDGWGAFSVLSMKDSKAFGGVLYKMKEMLKPKFGAKFISAKKVGQNSPYADTWGMPARTDIDALLSFLEA